jgi:F0F1-type ATP synthase delta subunit
MVPKESSAEVLPSQISTPGDLSRLIRELDNLDEYLNQAALRSSQDVSKLPQTSKALEELASMNSLNLLKTDDRKAFKELLDEIKKSAPTIHFGFATPPSITFLNKLVTWLRSNIHPQLLIRIGLEPSIVGGCMVRTTNKQFDFTLRKHFILKHDVLLQGITGSKEPSTNE